MSDILNSTQIETLRIQLEAARQSIATHIKRTSAAAKPVALDQQAVGRVSRIDAIQQQKMTQAGQQFSKEALQRVVFALKRIESGEYGLCLRCAETIAFARLQAQPHVTLCIECQSASEAGKAPYG